jgi:hypothetical protein
MLAIPPDDADELTWLLFRQDNIITRRQALQLMSASSLRQRVRSGRWQTVHRGVFAAHTGELTYRQRCWVAVLSAAAGGQAYLAGVSALQLAGLDRLTDRFVHVLIPGARRDTQTPPGVLVHRSTVLPEDDLRRVAAPPATMPARSVVDAAQWAASDNAARTFIAMAVQRGLVTEDEVIAVVDRFPTIRRRRLIYETIADAAGGAHSLPELEFLALCRRAGLPMPTRQASRVDRRGRRRFSDAYFEEAGVHVEIDGGHHMDVEQWWQDMRRQNDLWALGERVVRFPAWAIRHDPDTVIAQLSAALGIEPWKR